jgi:hypothetical protein
VVIRGGEPDIGAELTAIRCRWPRMFGPPLLAAVWWCNAPDTARVITAVLGDLRSIHTGNRSLGCNATTVTATVGRATRNLNVALTVHDAALDRAKGATWRIQQVVDAAASSGDLAFFDRAYRQHRLSA